VSEKPDGVSTLAQILKNADVSFGEKILKRLDADDPLLSTELQERLYTLDDVVRAENRTIADKLRGMTDYDIAILLKGRPDDFVNKIMANLSSTRKSQVRAESDFLGPIRKKDADIVLNAFLSWFRAGRENGEILLEGDDLVV
jgi:flagellar motor switch protein FliG